MEIYHRDRLKVTGTEIFLWATAGTLSLTVLFACIAAILRMDAFTAAGYGILAGGVLTAGLTLARLSDLAAEHDHHIRHQRRILAETHAREALTLIPQRPSNYLMIRDRTGQRIPLAAPEPEAHVIVVDRQEPLATFIKRGINEGDWTRERMCTELRLMSQPAWREARNRLISYGILDRQGNLAVDACNIKLTEVTDAD